MESKVAVLGSADFVMPFSALGLDTFATSERPEETVEMANDIIDSKYALVVVAEIAEVVEETFAIQINRPTPCIVVVPFTTESQGFATRSLGEVSTFCKTIKKRF